MHLTPHLHLKDFKSLDSFYLWPLSLSIVLVTTFLHQFRGQCLKDGHSSFRKTSTISHFVTTMSATTEISPTSFAEEDVALFAEARAPNVFDLLRFRYVFAPTADSLHNEQEYRRSMHEKMVPPGKIHQFEAWFRLSGKASVQASYRRMQTVIPSINIDRFLDGLDMGTEPEEQAKFQG